MRPNFYSEEEYYATPVDNLRTYPVYHPDYQPKGYLESLKALGPRPLIEPEKLKTKHDWLKAGRRVFDELDIVEYRTNDPRAIAWVGDAAAVAEGETPVTRDGVLPVYRWVVVESGELKLSMANCAVCHVRLMDDKTILRGAPGNLASGGAAFGAAIDIMLAQDIAQKQLPPGESAYVAFGVPWRKDDVHARLKAMKDEEVEGTLNEGPSSPGTFNRFNGSPYWTTRFADLIGVKDRRYLDATATHANRGPADIARYGILVQFADDGSVGPHHVMSAEQRKRRLRVRPADEAMYALGLYIYSLEPPKSPHPFDDQAKRGQKIFEAEGCTECHTPPIYTNNKLVAVPGFEPPMDDPATQRLDISKRRVGTDPGLALKTRKGTGYYKIPSLRGLWYRGLHEHSGSVSSLEDWFDPKRLRDDYVPTGWKGPPGTTTRAVPGHKFGHDLSDEDKRALIAFLKTL